ncbi:hypothetical protein CHS0354_008561, partial [Potamilus streckersoni]
ISNNDFNKVWSGFDMNVMKPDMIRQWTYDINKVDMMRKSQNSIMQYSLSHEKKM